MMGYDVVVIGAGIEGSSTAYHLIKNGAKRVLLLEQFFALHTRGSTHGHSRLTRKAVHANYPELQRMIGESSKVFAELEEQSGKELCIPIDIMSFGSKSCPQLKRMVEYLKKEGAINPIISAEEVNSRYPSQVNLPLDYHTVRDTDTALFKLTDILSLFQKLFVSGGGVFLDNHCVTDILPGDQVTVRTNKGDFVSRKVIITAGAWANTLLSKLGVDLPLKVQRAEVFYWKVDCPEKFKHDVFPLLIFEKDEDHFYVFPVYEYPGMVKAYCRTSRLIDPDHRDEGGSGLESVEKVTEFIKKYLKGVSTTPSIFEPCIYTMTPDGMPIIDRVLSHPNIMFAAGLSGKGFKISPAVGQVLTELTLDRPLSFDLSPFRLDRFRQKSKSKL